MKTKEVSIIRRLINFIIDSCVIAVSSFLTFYLFSIIYLKLHLHPVNEDIEIIRLDLLILLVFVTYYLIFESFTGKTIGKYITKTKVLKTDLTKPNFLYILLRTIIRLIPFDFLTFLSKKNGWHDRFSSTVVIND
ncbi:MAG: RDD family protein [Bacteroidetes bacterium]|jgi:uncharacterized RDD family membrane protein YckC|nr:RDD family protein [Bacteroidota bacterium]